MGYKTVTARLDWPQRSVDVGEKPRSLKLAAIADTEAVYRKGFPRCDDTETDRIMYTSNSGCPPVVERVGPDTRMTKDGPGVLHYPPGDPNAPIVAYGYYPGAGRRRRRNRLDHRRPGLATAHPLASSQWSAGDPPPAYATGLAPSNSVTVLSQGDHDL